MGLKPTKFYSPGYNRLVDIIAYRSMSLLMPMAYHTFLLINGLPLRGSSLVLVHPTLNLFTHQFTVNFFFTFCVLYTHHILVWISPSETFSNIKNRITLLRSSLDTACRCRCHCYFSHHHVIFNRSLQNFACALGIPSVICTRSFDVTVLPHAENGWAMQHFWRAPRR